MRAAFEALELTVTREEETEQPARGTAWTVNIPSWRDDLDRPIDLVEEVLHHGGDHFVTARLLSQELETSRLDWRAAGSRLRVEPDRLPRDVEEACRRVMENLGILFGCFDFIVTPEGEHVFLEVNPAGQFLWVEEANPELRLLAPFVAFLLSRDPAFRWRCP